MARILVIDDDDDVRALCRDVLEGIGHQVVEASNGLEGIRAFHENPAIVVLCDIFMPVTDGFETIVKLKNEYPGVKIIVVSGRLCDGMNYADIARRLGAVRTIEKPFDVEELVTVVQETIDAI
jgi:two-component system response regulator (stage 0 sporulation protein F)